MTTSLWNKYAKLLWPTKPLTIIGHKAAKYFTIASANPFDHMLTQK
jgi:hypothetical protein